MLSNNELGGDSILQNNQHSPYIHKVSVSALAPHQKTIQAQFQKHYESLLLSNKSNTMKLHDLLALSDSLDKDLTFLIDYKTKEEKVRMHLVLLHQLISAFQNNEQLIHGRAYFLELIEQNQKAVDVLLEYCSIEENDLFNTYIDEQKHVGLLTNTIHLASTLGFIPIFMYRVLLSQNEQEYINELLPKTSDAQAKKWMIGCIKRVVMTLETELILIAEEQESLHNCISFNDPILKDLIKMQLVPDFVLLSQLNKIEHSYQELLPYLDTSSEEFIQPTAQINALLVQPYMDIINDNSEEQHTTEALIRLMHEMSTGLNSLIALKARQEHVRSNIASLKALFYVFNKHTTHCYLESLIDLCLNNLFKELEELEPTIDVLIKNIAPNNEALMYAFKTSSSEALDKIKENYGIKPVFPSHASFELIVTTHNVLDFNITDFIYKYYYINMIHDDSKNNDELLLALSHNGVAVDKQINQILEQRTFYEKRVLQVQKIKRVINLLEEAQANTALINLIKERLLSCEHELASTYERIGILSHDLSCGDREFKQLLMRHPLKHLSDALVEHQEMKRCVNQYKTLRDKIIIRLEMIDATRALTHYVATHRHWWIVLTDFFAQWCSLFKTDTARVLDKAMQLNAELECAIKSCETEIAEDIVLVKEHEQRIGEELLDDLPLHHVYSHKNQKPFDADKAFNLLSHGSFFRDKQSSFATSSNFCGLFAELG